MVSGRMEHSVTLYSDDASCLPVWLLQPRDCINSHQLKAVILALTLAILIKGPKLAADAIPNSDTSSQEIQDRSPIFPTMFTLDSSCKSIGAEVKKRLTEWRRVLERARVRVHAFGFGQKCTDWQVVMVSASLLWPVWCSTLVVSRVRE